jgi:O-6-methylguanine DNA methyltransferase
METAPMPMFYCAVKHPIATVVLWGYEKRGRVLVSELRLARPCMSGGAKVKIPVHPTLQLYAESVRRFLDGNEHDLSDIPVDLSWCTPFALKVLLAARKVGWGRTISYAELARRAGNGRAIRAAASVMRNNRFPLIIPCHRVIRIDGSIGGFMGKQSGEAVALKKRLLTKELPLRKEKKLKQTLKLLMGSPYS